MKSEKEKMLAGELYDASSPEIRADHRAAMDWLVRYNATLNAGSEIRRPMMRERFASVGENADIRPPFYCDYGFNISIGNGAFLNFNCTILDVVPVTIGDKTQIGPNVQILTADHPRDADDRSTGLEFGRPSHIGSNVWIGGGAVAAVQREHRVPFPSRAVAILKRLAKFKEGEFVFCATSRCRVWR
jgi:maltose O-acetyltransferase